MAGAGSSLADLIAQNTPDEVRQRYLTLAERAGDVSFGPLEEDVVVLDTETTGLSFKDCSLIEISAARLEGREVVERFQTFVRPDAPIPEQIERLTGITNKDVALAPSAPEAVAALAEFVGGCPVLAHNATFDRTFIEGVPGGAGVSDTWIDTLSLSRIALPMLTTHRLADMASAFGCASVTHRASDDVDALCGMWRIILLALSDLPMGLLALLAEMHPEVSWAFRPVFSYLSEDAGDLPPFSLAAHRRQLLEGVSCERRLDAREAERLDAPTQAEVEEAFSPTGVVSRMYAQMEHRPEQLAMALEVRDALASSTHRAIEAGTGVGKSVAYLVPEVLFAQRNHVTIGVATKTNALTDQLVSHELPALSGALPGGLTFSSLKGYDHYPCLRRLERAARDPLPVAQVPRDGRSENAVSCDMLTAIAVTYAFSCQAPDGDLDTLGIRWRYVPRQMLTTSPGACMRPSCPFFPEGCMLHGARRRAACSDVVVTNHSLLLRDVQVEGRILPPIRHWVVDEAHAFESEARRQWALEVSGERARYAFEQLGGTKSGAIHGAMVDLMGVEGDSLPLGLLSKAASSLSRASLVTADLFDAVHGLVGVARGGGGYDVVSLWIDEQVRSSSEWAAVMDAASAADDALDAACRDLAEAVSSLTVVAPQAAERLSSQTRYLKDLLDSLRVICDGTDTSYVYSAQLSRSARRISEERLNAEKIDVGSEIAARWLSETESVVFTSATMAVKDDFAHFDQSVGLSELGDGSHRDVRLESSFDYDANMSVIVTRDMPAPNEREYLPALVDLLFDVHVAMGGSVLTLFTNRRDMETAYEALRPRLAAAGLEVACQERGSSARRLRTRFLEERTLSLMALRSFWEGFDAAGETLRCVVIPKLPFASPTDPLVRERELREDRSWWRHSLPEAVISVKQAAGRLIRSASDTGVLVLGDSRVFSKRYGRLFVGSLPSRSVSELERANVGRFISLWRASHE